MITTLKEVTSKAQKEYRCMLCGCKIEVSQAYIRQTNLLGCPVRCSEKQMLKSPVKLLI